MMNDKREKESLVTSIIHQLNRIVKSNYMHDAVTGNYYYC